MLSHLSIRHYALIDHLEISFSPGLNIVTGETGSGKSIILGALSLILGERAEKRVVKEGEKKCVVEGTFRLDINKWEPIFDRCDLDFEESSILRREVLASGKSRAFVNDTPVNLKLMRDIALDLVDIHSQHQTIQLNDPNFQLGVIDAFAKARRELEGYQDAFRAYTAAQKELDTLKEKLSNDEQELDFIAFQLQEFEAVNLDDLNQTEIDEEYALLSNSEEIAQKLSGTSEMIASGSAPVLLSLREAENLLRDLAEYAKVYKDLHGRLHSVAIELDDIHSEVESTLESIEIHPERLRELEELRSLIFSLEKKHNVQGILGLATKRNELAGRISGTEKLENQIADLENRLAGLLSSVKEAADKLSQKRKGVSGRFVNLLEGLLALLNMKKASFKLNFEKLENPAPSGLDKLEMLFSANSGRKPEPLRAVASGGELSRLMLSIKKLSASQGHTIILDEIDTGVSGEVAHSMGKIMQEMGKGQQVISITHLPQIASKGSAHFKVYKEEVEDGSKTVIAKLSETERVEEIAQMLSGAETTAAAMDNARELLLAD